MHGSTPRFQAVFRRARAIPAETQAPSRKRDSGKDELRNCGPRRRSAPLIAGVDRFFKPGE